MKGDTMKVNAISSIEKHIKPAKLVNFPKTHDEALVNLFGQSDKDYFNLTHASKPENSIEKPLITFAEGFKNFFERGTMF